MVRNYSSSQADADSGKEWNITGNEVTLDFPEPRLSRLLWLKFV